MLNVIAKLKNSYTIKHPLKKSNSGGQEEDVKGGL